MRNEIDKLSRLVNDALRRRCLTLAVAESCTGGGIAAAITSVPGSSDIFNGGVVAYSNEAKNNLLSVSVEDLCTHGAVSEAVVRQMALGVATIMHASCAIATSGIAGPGGGTAEKPVGTVWTAFLLNGVVKTCKLNLEDRGRKENTESAILETIKIFHSLLCDN